MLAPLVDVIIAVHSATRPIARAVASVLDHTIAPVRVSVIAHNIDPEIIRGNLGEYADHPGLRLLSLADGIPSAAGPMNLGISRAEAPYLSILGSDDEFAPGAIDSWLGVAQRTGAQAVLARIQLVTGGTDPYPPVRNGHRTRNLHGRKDRLAYRSAPLGLVSREQFGSLRLTEGLQSGEDLTYSLTLWYTGARIAYDLEGPPYIGHDDSHDRVTAAPRSIAQDFVFLDELTGLSWFTAAARGDRIAIIVKLIRIHLFDAILARVHSQEALDAHRTELLALIARLISIAPESKRLLSLSDRAVFAALENPESTAEQVLATLSARHAYLSPASLLPRNLFYALHRQAPFRTLLAGYRITRRFSPKH